ncbi:hypothetical protein KKC1_24850 [Calderihabitans maritimus]|uniref:Uncharacterized protein n=1 Tax=Calderihabitans maritimus TaxID=1246530 RepID=A0A1Z5HVC6_9FIRM|nr:hypothetical protein KKC1_24850 [Calderihabitans maritimus]
MEAQMFEKNTALIRIAYAPEKVTVEQIIYTLAKIGYPASIFKEEEVLPGNSSANSN